MNKRILLAALLVLALGLTVSAVPQAADPAKAVDPVCKMTVTKAGAKWTFDYKGTTYYFCSEGCKTSFGKDPGKYLAPEAEATKAEPKMMSHAGMMGGQMQGQAQGQIQCPMQKQMQAQAPMPQPAMGGQAQCQMQCQMQAQAPMHRGAMGMRHGMMGGMRMPMGPGRMGMRQGLMGGMMGAGPLMMEGVDKKVQNTKDGAVITLSSKDPETVKVLQERLAQMLEREKMMQERQAKMKEAQAAAKKAGEGEGACADCPSKKK